MRSCLWLLLVLAVMPLAPAGALAAANEAPARAA